MGRAELFETCHRDARINTQAALLNPVSSWLCLFVNVVKRVEEGAGGTETGPKLPGFWNDCTVLPSGGDTERHLNSF